MAQLYSGGIIIATGFKTDAPQLIDDRCAVELDSDLYNIPNLCKGLHAYSDENGGSLHYYNGTNWIKIATGGDLSEMDLQAVLNNGNIANTWFQLGDPDSELGAMQYFDNQFRHIKNDHIFDLIFPDFDEEISIDYPKKSGTFALIDDIDTALEDYIPQSEKGANNGVATLDGGGKIPATQLPNSVMTLEGEWNASTNTPTLVDGTGNAGMVYEVTTAGTQNLGSGSITFAVGDYVVYGSSGVWYKSINSNEVTSVNGQTGVVSLDYDDVGAEQAFTKNTAFNKDFGITGGTVAQGDDIRILNGQTAYGWGNHAGLYQPLDADLTSIAGLSGTTGLLRKTAADTWSLDTNTYATESYVNSNLTLQETLTNGNQFSWGGGANEKLVIDTTGFRFGIGSNYSHAWIGNISGDSSFRPGIQIAGTLFSSTPHIHRIVNDGTPGGGTFEHILPKKNGTFAHIEDVEDYVDEEIDNLSSVYLAKPEITTGKQYALIKSGSDWSWAEVITLSNGDVSLTVPRKIDTNGNPFSIEELPDKRTDTTFNQFLGKNSSGQLARVGYQAFVSEANAWDDEQRKAYAQLLNGNFSSAGASVNMISPPVFQLENNNVYIVLRGANLNLHPTNRKIEILDAADNSILAEVPNGQVQTYSDGLQLIFYYNFNSLGAGNYKLKITNSAATYITTLNFQIVAEVNNIDLSENSFDIITDYENTESFATNDTVYYEAEDYGTSSPTPIFSAKSDELFEMGDDWYLEIQLELAWGSTSAPQETPQSRIGIGYSNSTNELIYKTLNYYYHRKSNNNFGFYSTKGVAESAMALPFSTNVIFIKRGNIITAVCQGKIYNEVISNNSGYSLFVQIPKRIVKEVLSVQIIKAYKFS